MAKRLDTEIHEGVVIPRMYWMIGEVRLRPVHQTARIEVLGYVSEEARRRKEGLPPPVEVRGIEVHYNHYMKYFSPEALSKSKNNPIAAAYSLLANEPHPIGMKEFFESAEDV